MTACQASRSSDNAESVFEWQTASPASQGMSLSALHAARERLQRRKTKTLLVIRNDRIVYEWYADTWSRSTKHYTASMAKALVGGMSLALALDDGVIDPDEPVSKYVPAWRDDPRKSKITPRHLATHSSGLADAHEPDKAHEQLTGWKGDFWKRTPDPFTISRDHAPVLFEPGSKFTYSNPGMAMLAWAVTAAMRDAPGAKDLRTLLRQRVMDPIGTDSDQWSCGYGQTYTVDGLPLVANWGGGGYSPDAVARVARLMLRKGNWQGKQLIRRETVERVLADAGMPTPRRQPPDGPFPRSGLCWYVNTDRVWGDVPPDAFAAAGAGNQMLLVVPSLDLIVVRNGGLLEPDSLWGGAVEHLFDPILAAVEPKGKQPIPPSSVVRSIEFAPASSIVRKADGSDNWPITWADDDHLYTAYGDGWGFEPRTDIKLSNGLARVTGGPEGFGAENIRTPTGETTGDGPAGGKASGMLMVDGVLYMWVRNTDLATLAWSTDHARTWQWGFKFTEGFGCPTFLNFGRNYAGARDDYVYVYSQDGPNAYDSFDHMVLARVAKGRITDRQAYEFFAGLDANGQARWAAAIDQRRPVFTLPGRCQRSDVVYSPGIKRYLLCLGFNHSGGWGIFDAPEPWGPWTTAYYTDDWGLDHTHGYRPPTKWISPDGLTMWLIYSGRGQDDAFCVRKCHLTVR